MMKPRPRGNIRLVSIVAGLASMMMTSPVTSQSGGGFVITKNTIDGGGGQSTGSGFVITGTIAQWDATTQTLTGSGYQLGGGFWADPNETDLIFSNDFESN